MANDDALDAALIKAYAKRGEWILKQQEIAKAKVVVEQLSISNQVFTACGDKVQHYLKDYGATIQRFSAVYTKLSEEGSKSTDEALEAAKNSSSAFRQFVLQNAMLGADARQIL